MPSRIISRTLLAATIVAGVPLMGCESPGGQVSVLSGDENDGAQDGLSAIIADMVKTQPPGAPPAG